MTDEIVNEDIEKTSKSIKSPDEAILFKISIVKFTNKYSRVKKSSLSLPFLKNNFKMIKDIRHEKASEFK